MRKNKRTIGRLTEFTNEGRADRSVSTAIKIMRLKARIKKLSDSDVEYSCFVYCMPSECSGSEINHSTTSDSKIEGKFCMKLFSHWKLGNFNFNVLKYINSHHVR